MLDLFKKYLDLGDFAEIRAVVNQNNTISVKNAEVEKTVSGSLSAFSFRVLHKGAWGFASSNDFSKIPETAKKALKLAKVSHKKSLESKLSLEKPSKDKVEAKVKINPENIPLDQKIKDLLEINKEMKIDKKIVSYDTYYLDSTSNWHYLNSENSEIFFKNSISLITFSSFAKDGLLQGISRNFGGTIGYEILEKYGKESKEISRIALSLLKADLIKSGIYDTVIDQRMAGTLAHEAVGHACEADFVLTGESLLRNKIGKRIGSELVTIIDNPAIPEAFGYYPYDDEGVKARKNVLIDHGILQSFLHSRETAEKFKTNSTGNARAQAVSHFPIVRMSNTYFGIGDSDFEELIDLKKGLYVVGMKGGAVDISTGNFQFAAEQGFLIEKGELTKKLRDITVFGNILETLKKIDGVGKDFKGFHPGTCGKGLQLLRVSDGAPSIRIRNARIGGK